jgi:general secretion pathway protein N
MRIEGVAPRTWLLATLTGWALLLWLLALLGMGERAQGLPDDPSLLARLPQLAPASPERLGPLAQYDAISTRPLFSEDRRPQPFSLSADGDADSAPAFDYVLTSVLLTPNLRMAIVQPSAGGDSIRIRLGEAAEEQPSYRLTNLEPRRAVFEGPEGPRTLELRVFDGTGGEPPTALTRTGNGEAAMPRPPAPTAPARPGKPKPAPPAAMRKDATTPAVDAADAADAADVDADAEPNRTTQAQLDSIRKRIEERRAQLRQQSQNPAAPDKTP